MAELGLGGRSGCLLWSPNSRLIAYEYDGSSTGNAIGVSRVLNALRVEKLPIDQQIESAVRKIIGKRSRPHTIRYELVGWSSNSKVLSIKVTGVGSVPKGSEFSDRVIQVSVP